MVAITLLNYYTMYIYVSSYIVSIHHFVLHVDNHMDCSPLKLLCSFYNTLPTRAQAILVTFKCLFIFVTFISRFFVTKHSCS